MEEITVILLRGNILRNTILKTFDRNLFTVACGLI